MNSDFFVTFVFFVVQIPVVFASCTGHPRWCRPRSHEDSCPKSQISEPCAVGSRSASTALTGMRRCEGLPPSNLLHPALYDRYDFGGSADRCRQDRNRFSESDSLTSLAVLGPPEPLPRPAWGGQAVWSHSMMRSRPMFTRPRRRSRKSSAPSLPSTPLSPAPRGGGIPSGASANVAITTNPGVQQMPSIAVDPRPRPSGDRLHGLLALDHRLRGHRCGRVGKRRRHLAGHVDPLAGPVQPGGGHSDRGVQCPGSSVRQLRGGDLSGTAAAHHRSQRRCAAGAGLPVR